MCVPPSRLSEKLNTKLNEDNNKKQTNRQINEKKNKQAKHDLHNWGFDALNKTHFDLLF